MSTRAIFLSASAAFLLSGSALLAQGLVDWGASDVNDFNCLGGQCDQQVIFDGPLPDVPAVPLPASILLLGAGVLGLGAYGRMRKKRT